MRHPKANNVGVVINLIPAHTTANLLNVLIPVDTVILIVAGVKHVF